jgi:hypothetical protein
MGVCHAYTKMFKKCRGNAGPYRLCHIHEKWYTHTQWLPYILKHLNVSVNFEKIIDILLDPFTTYYSSGSIPSFEAYLDILYETGPIHSRDKIVLLYSIGCRCKRFQASAAPMLWNACLKVNIDIALMYYRNFLATFHPSRFKHLILDALGPYLHDESFEIFIVFVIFMLKREVSVEECKIFMNFTLECIDWRSYKFHEKVSEMNKKYMKYVAYLHKAKCSYRVLQQRIQDAKEVFEALEAILKTDHVLALKPFQEELFDVVYHPDNFQKLIPLDHSN